MLKLGIVLGQLLNYVVELFLPLEVPQDDIFQRSYMSISFSSLFSKVITLDCDICHYHFPTVTRNLVVVPSS